MEENYLRKNSEEKFRYHQRQNDSNIRSNKLLNGNELSKKLLGFEDNMKSL